MKYIACLFAYLSSAVGFIPIVCGMVGTLTNFLLLLAGGIIDWLRSNDLFDARELLTPICIYVHAPQASSGSYTHISTQHWEGKIGG